MTVLETFKVYTHSIDVALNKAAEEARDWLQAKIYEDSTMSFYADLVLVGAKLEIVAHGPKDDVPEWTFELRSRP